MLLEYFKPLPEKLSKVPQRRPPPRLDIPNILTALDDADLMTAIAAYCAYRFPDPAKTQRQSYDVDIIPDGPLSGPMPEPQLPRAGQPPKQIRQKTFLTAMQEVLSISPVGTLLKNYAAKTGRPVQRAHFKNDPAVGGLNHSKFTLVAHDKDPITAAAIAAHELQHHRQSSDLFADLLTINFSPLDLWIRRRVVEADAFLAQSIVAEDLGLAGYKADTENLFTYPTLRTNFSRDAITRNFQTVHGYQGAQERNLGFLFHVATSPNMLSYYDGPKEEAAVRLFDLIRDPSCQFLVQSPFTTPPILKRLRGDEIGRTIYGTGPMLEDKFSRNAEGFAHDIARLCQTQIDTFADWWSGQCENTIPKPNAPQRGPCSRQPEPVLG
jgi:hypothetical protein